MQKLGQIDPSKAERLPPSHAEREAKQQEQQQQKKEQLYQQLVELCNLGEYAAARHLARRYEGYGYEIIAGEVVEG